MGVLALNHKCEQLATTKVVGYGPAVTDIWYSDEDPAGWYMDNGEYSSGPIVCCPFCGVRLAFPRRKEHLDA